MLKLYMWDPGGGGGGTPKKLGRRVRPASKNLYPIYDQNLRFPYPIYDLAKNLKPRLWPDTLLVTKMAKIDTLFMTKTAEKPYPLGPHIPV